MATTNIAADIQNITGVGTADAQFLISAQKFVVSSIPKNLLKWASTFTVPGNHGGNTSDGVTITMPVATDSVLDVSRNGFSAIEVPYDMKGFIANTASLHLASNTYPKYYLNDTNPGEGSKVIVKPIPTDSETAVVLYVDSSKIDDDSDLRNAVVFHASSKEFTKLGTAELPTISIKAVPPDVPSLTTITYTGLSSDEDTGSVSDITHTTLDISGATQPSYNSGAVVGLADGTLTVEMIDTALSITDLTVTAVPPDSPIITVSAISFSTAAPTYTTPTTTISGTSWATAYPDEYSAINTALAAITTEIGLAKTEVLEIATQTDNGGDFETALDAINTELDKVDDIIVEASTEFDEAKNLSDAHDGELETAITAIRTNVDLANAVVDSIPVPPDSVSDTIADFSLAGEFDNAMDNAKALINNASALSQGEDVEYWLNDEDPEMVAATIQVASQELQRANLGLQDALQTFNTDVQKFQASGIGVYNAEVQSYQAEVGAMTSQSQGYIQTAQGYVSEIQAYSVAGKTFIDNGNAYINEAQAYIAQANGYANEVSARGGFTSAKTQAVQGYIQTAQNYANEVQSLLSQTPMKVSEYQIKVQNSLNEFNKLNVEYQAQLQISLQNAQKENEEESKKIQKYSAEVQEYQAEVNTEIQEWQANTNKDLQVWQQTNTMSLQEHASRMQDALNLFNEENVEYQAEVQEKIQQAQIDNQENLQNMQKALQIAIRDADRSQEHQIQEKMQDLQAVVADNQSLITKYQNELGEYQAEVSAETVEYQNKLQKQQVYAKESEKYYSWAQMEVNSYIKNNSKMIGMTMAAQAQPQS